MTSIHFKNSRQAMNTTKKKGPRKYDVYLAKFILYDTGNNGKGRPVIIGEVRGSTAVVYRCSTSKNRSNRWYRVMDPVAASLAKDSYVDPSPLEIPSSRLEPLPLGKLCQEDRAGLSEAIMAAREARR